MVNDSASNACLVPAAGTFISSIIGHLCAFVVEIHRVDRCVTLSWVHVLECFRPKTKLSSHALQVKLDNDGIECLARAKKPTQPHVTRVVAGHDVSSGDYAIDARFQSNAQNAFDIASFLDARYDDWYDIAFGQGATRFAGEHHKQLFGRRKKLRGAPVVIGSNELLFASEQCEPLAQSAALPQHGSIVVQIQCRKLL